MEAKRKVTLAIAVLIVLYVAGYLAVRQTYSEVWERDGKVYVLFPSSGIYYLFRPVTYLDAALTGMRFHIGPHH
jgi:hypothetical protein